MIDNRQIQSLFSAAGVYSGAIDGVLGKQTYGAVKAILAREAIVPAFNDNSIAMAMQALLNKLGYEAGEVDGKWGHNSQSAFDAWAYKNEHGTRLIVPRVQVSDLQISKAQAQMPRQKDMNSFYGAVGTNQMQIRVPFPMRLAWDTNTIVNKITVHQKIADQTLGALGDILTTYGSEKISELGLDLFGGSLNVRKMRGGTNWSMHSWGAAFDFDPARNQLRWGKDRAQFAKPEYQDYLDIWEARGATSLLRAANMDAMHIQFARI